MAEAMNIKLPTDQIGWLEEQVAAGHFTSIDEALVVAVADLMTIQNDDLVWAKPFVDEAHASVARGGVVPGDEFLGRLDLKLAALRSR